ISIGQYLAERDAPSEGTMSLLLSRAIALESANRRTSGLLRDIVHRWPSTIGDRDIALQIQNNSISAHSILYALRRRDSFRKHCMDAIEAARTLSGVPAGFFAILSGDREREIQVLKGSDRAAIQTLLAGARLIRESLPLEEAGRLYNSGDTS